MKSFLKTPRKRAISFYVVFVLTIGIFLFAGVRGSFIAGKYIDSIERESLENLVETSATQIDVNKIRNLNKDSSDLLNPDYIFLKNQLKEIKSANEKARFVYLFGLNEKGEVIFLVDSESPGESGYSAPGEIYYESSEKEVSAFYDKSVTVYTEGPSKDRWGTWVTGLSVIRDEKGEVVAQLGFDVDAKTWIENASYVETLVALIVFSVVFFLVILFLGARRLLLALDNEQKSKELLSKEEAKLVSVVENTQDAIWSCDLEGRVLTSNAVAKKFFREWYHFSLETNVENSHISYDGKRFFRDEYEKVRKGERFIVEFSKKINNVERWIECSYNPIVSESGEVIGINVFARDFSDRKQVEKFRQELVAFASHELRTPLTGIKWFAELLVSDKENPMSPKQKEGVENIYRTTEMTLRLVKNFLESSKMDRSGELILLQKKNDISFLLRDVISAEKVFFEKKNIKYTVNDFFNEPHVFVFDEEKIRYVLQNLINNAIKYSKDGSVVEIKGAFSGENIEISVKDFGIGIPENEKEKIFNRAYRATNAISSGIEGNGLGLYLVKAIVSAHKGKIDFHSVRGEGTVFVFSIPFIKDIPDLV